MACRFCKNNPSRIPCRHCHDYIGKPADTGSDTPVVLIPDDTSATGKTDNVPADNGQADGGCGADSCGCDGD